MSPVTPDTTQLLHAWAGGDRQALDELTPRIYDSLRKLAGYMMQEERPGTTLQTTALVHEVYLKMIDVTNVDWQHRAHFFAIAGRMMRRILLDQARRRVAAKRGGGAARVDLNDIPDFGSKRAREVIALEDSLNQLAEVDPRKAQVIELRFFAGLSVEETAEVLNVSPHTVMRDWRMARAWLSSELDCASGKQS